MLRTNSFGGGRWQAWLVAAFLVVGTASLTSPTSPPVLTVYDTDGKPCILMAATLRLSYPFNASFTPTINNASSSCTEAVLKIATNQYISFTFQANTTSWWLAETAFSHDDTIEANDTVLFTLKLQQSYQCNSAQNIALGNLTLTVTEWRVQAFNFTSLGSFDSSLHCSFDPRSAINTVPIAVGAALGGLVLVTLVAYLVGRFKRRSVLSVTGGSYERLPS